MPRYFFHLIDDLYVEDLEGTVLPDIAAARNVATQNARLMAAEEVIAGKLHLGHRIEIAAETGQILETVRFAEAFQIVN